MPNIIKNQNDISTLKPHITYNLVGTGVLDCPQIELTQYGEIADKYIKQLNDFYEHLSVEKYVIMPNHIHFLLWVNFLRSNYAFLDRRGRRSLRFEIHNAKPHLAIKQEIYHQPINTKEPDKDVGSVGFSHIKESIKSGYPQACEAQTKSKLLRKFSFGYFSFLKEK